MNNLAHFKRAKKRGRVVVEPKANEIFIDIDGPIEYQFYKKQLRILEEGGITQGWTIRETPSETDGHVHIIVILPIRYYNGNSRYEWVFTSATTEGLLIRIGLAAILCDDPHRAAFNFVRAWQKAKYPVVFFEKPKRKKG